MEKHIAWLDAEEKELEKQVLGEYSSDQVRKHLEYLTTLTRRAGTEDELKAAKYIKNKLEEYGVDGRIHEIDAYISLPGEAELEILSPVQRSIPCLPRTFIPSTPPNGIEAELILVPGSGSKENDQGIDLRGKIVLVELGYREGRIDSLRIAEERGAAGQIQVTGKALHIHEVKDTTFSGLSNQVYPAEKSRLINIGQIRYTWGNPTPDTMDKIPSIPVISISNEDGRDLTDLTRKGPVVVRLKADVWRGYKKIRLPMGDIKGTKNPEKYILLGGHFCSWFTGAVDNAAASSLILEMARIFSKNRKHLSRSIKFAWWSGHEQGTYASSTWYLDNFWEDIRDHAVAFVVMDAIGRLGSSGFESRNTEDVRKFHERVIKEVLGIEVKSNRVSKIGDQSFWGMGIPSTAGNTTFTDEQSAAMGGNPHWYSHTIEDTLDKVDMQLVSIPFKINATSVLRLCNNPVLPFEFVTMAEIFEKRLDDLQKAGGSFLDLTPLINQTEELEKRAKALNKGIAKNLSAFVNKRTGGRSKSKFEEINACLMGLSRILIPALSSKAGKYGQDPIFSRYKLIPTLQPMEELNSMDREGEECKALMTSLLRERNKLSDALNLANHILDSTLSRI
ncbi:MAG: M28 family peptidase [Thermodesulfobacteriota bacterium]